ncbi:FAD-binding oxidoreductase [Vulcanisaeta thermophila]|uniref:FAD-binding oxidoreductase n=1 Tax=Vulcanisaeta thermophila TaxID=867917 RepID=UPI0008535131|nr:FAD-binding oxidoreductase [Vulcanisaeta thermophila]
MLDIVNRLIKEVGEDKVATGQEVLTQYSHDFWPLLLMKIRYFKEELPKPIAVVYPEDVNDVVKVIKILREYKTAKLVVYGGGSSVTGASAPMGNAVVLDMRRMRKILDFNEYDLMVTVETGIYLRDLEAELNKRGFSIRHIPQSFNYATIGGLIATMSSGQFSTLYGNIEDIVINMEVVLPSGEVTWLRRNNAPRSSTGPSLKYLFIGSEGMLGVITKAVLRVVPTPTSVRYGAFIFPSFKQGIEALRELMLRRLIPAVARLYDEQESRIRFSIDGSLLIISFEGYDDELTSVIWNKAITVVKGHGGNYVGEEPYERWLSTRFNVEEEISLIEKLGLWFDTIEISSPWSRLYELYRDIRDSTLNINGVFSIMAHVSHLYINGACVYFTVIFKPSEEVYWRIWDNIMRITINGGGSISHHHGIGILRSKWLVEELGKGLNVLKEIKNALDAHGLFRNLD